MIDHDDEVRSNTIFTVGVLCSQSDGALNNEYENIIKDLFIILNNEKNKQVLDNICGTLCRICYSGFLMNVSNISYATVSFYFFIILSNFSKRKHFFFNNQNLLFKRYPSLYLRQF